MKAKDLYPAIFSRHAIAYQQRLEEMMSRGEARGRLRLLELAAVQPGMRVLDLACGPGTMSRLLAERASPGGAVVGVDLAPGMVRAARRSTPNASFAVMDVESLALADSSFDAAVCGHGLQFVPDLGRALREARRVLRASGGLCTSIPAAEVKESVWALIDEVVDRWLPPSPVVVDADATRATVSEPAPLRAAALEAGFHEATVESIEEEVLWESAEKLVSMFMGWWDFGFRIEGMDSSTRAAFEREATEALRRKHPGVIRTLGRTLVMRAAA